VLTSQEKKQWRRTKEFQTFKKKLFEHYDYRCQLCGTQHKKGLHPHHIIENAYQSETFNNCKPLCPTCHQFVEYWLRRFNAQIKTYQDNRYTQAIHNIVKEFGSV
jgi:5-methylcytosine-specific restriction endonuclease McrA